MASIGETLRGATRRAPLLTLALAAALLAGCGGGVPADPPDPGQTAGAFVLTGAAFGRPILDVDGQLVEVVNPSSLHEVDALTGVPLAGFPKPLQPGQPLDTLVSLNLDQIQDPLTPLVPLVPRNAALVLEFSNSILPASLQLTDADPDNPNQLSPDSPVQVRRQDGTPVAVRAWVDDTRLVLSAVLDDTPGWEPSPLQFDALGHPVEDPTGHLRVHVHADPGAPLLAVDFDVLQPREDLLGSDLDPLPFNPGNSLLDALLLQTANGTVGFNGFLPDLSPPRIVRPVERAGTLSAIGADTVGPDVVVELRDATLEPPPNTTANGGAGEWARALIEITTSVGTVSRHVVLDNLEDPAAPGVAVYRLEPGEVLDPAVAPGDAYRLVRTEAYEPIPPPLPADPSLWADLTVDPDAIPRDPDDPQDALNHDLRHFLTVTDEEGVPRTDVWDPAIGVFAPIPPRSRLGLRFNEPMDPASFDPYASFYVTADAIPKTDPAFLDMRPGRVETEDGQRVLFFSPVLEDQVDPSASAFVGFGGTASGLRLVLRTVPEVGDLAQLEASLPPHEAAQLVDLVEAGVPGLTDLGGRGLGLPRALTDPAHPVHFVLEPGSVGAGPFPPAVDLAVGFETLPSEDPDHGVIVHRFMGQPVTQAFTPPPGPADTVQKGVEYHDYPPVIGPGGEVERRFLYGPRLLDVGLAIPGQLSGAPASTIEHIIDDFNKPSASAYASPSNQDFLIAQGFGVNNPIVAPFGARFQHIYRAGDASPAWYDFEGVGLDLVGLAWSPLLNQQGTGVISTSIDSFEILVGLGSSAGGKGPNTNQNNGIPAKKDSGLEEHFDCNLLEWAGNCCENIDGELVAHVDGQPPLTTVVSEGTKHAMQQSGLFTPANATGTASGFNPYLDYPAFDSGLDPYFGDPGAIGFPYDSRFAMLIEYRLRPNAVPQASNVYRYSPGILTSVLPRFRTWSQGQDPLAWGVPNHVNGAAENKSWRAGNGGPLLEPGGNLPPSAQNGQIPGQPQPPGTGPSFPTPPYGNGMPPIPLDPGDWSYILPPHVSCNTVAQKVPDGTSPNFPGGPPTPPPYPQANSDPDMAFYFATGDLAYPVPDLNCYPGPAGLVPTSYYGYGGTLNTGCTAGVPIEPGHAIRPALYGDNSRYYMLWRYRKRVSVIESPTIEADTPTGRVRWLRPIVDPPPAAGVDMTVEFRASKQLEMANPFVESGYVSSDDPTLGEQLTGPYEDRTLVKFRATLGVAPGQNQGPTLDRVVIPYVKLP